MVCHVVEQEGAGPIFRLLIALFWARPLDSPMSELQAVAANVGFDPCPRTSQIAPRVSGSLTALGSLHGTAWYRPQVRHSYWP